MLSPNTILQGRYRIIRQLGRGGMGAVYEALNERISSVVALKETFAETEAQREAFEREAKRLANLEHDAFPKVMDHFFEGDGQYLVMELIRGNDLAELLKLRESPFALVKVLEWADQLLDALEELHAYPIIHRDIKPSNLKLTKKGKIKLLDFGIAKGAAGQMTTVKTDHSGGGYTPHYAPLEQTLRSSGHWSEALSIVDAKAVERIQQKTTDPRSDLYALGATLYHLLTGVIPPDAPTRALSVWTGKPDRLRPVHELNPQVPLSVSDVLMKTLALERDGRPATATALRRMLREAANQPLFVPPTELSAELEEQARQRREAQEQHLAEQERARQRAEEETRKRTEAEASEQLKARKRAEAEAREKLEAEEAARRAAEEEEQRRKTEEQQRLAAAERERAEEEERRRRESRSAVAKKAWETRRQAEDAQHRQEKERQRNEAEQRQREAEAETKLQRIETEHLRIAKQSERQREDELARHESAPVPTLPAPPPRNLQPGDAKPRSSVMAGKVRFMNVEFPRSLLIAGATLLLLATGSGLLLWQLKARRANENQAANANKSAVGQSSKGAATNSKGPATNPISPPSGMAYVPGGEFTMGRDTDDKYESPAHIETVGDFFIDLHEVTREEYAEFIKANGLRAPSGWVNGRYVPGDQKKPVTGASWYEARDYCKWAGKRLPTEQEWERAARGPGGLLYPWGDKWQRGYANADNEQDEVVDVGRYSGASHWGAVDMVGNAWEWTASRLDAYPGSKLPEESPGDKMVIRGGNYKSTKEQATTTYRMGLLPTNDPSGYRTTGFRCVKDVD